MRKYWPIGLAVVLASLALLAGLHSSADEVEAWTMASRYTARIGFPFFIIAYVASSLVKIRPSKLTSNFLRERKYFGLAFATTHTFHLYALLTFLAVSPEEVPLVGLLPGFAVYALIYAMALTSNRWGYRTLGRKWKWLHTTGMHVVWLAFALAYASRIGDPDEATAGLALFSIAVIALLIRIAAWRVGHSRRHA